MTMLGQEVTDGTGALVQAPDEYDPFELPFRVPNVLTVLPTLVVVGLRLLDEDVLRVPSILSVLVQTAQAVLSSGHLLKVEFCCKNQSLVYVPIGALLYSSDGGEVFSKIFCNIQKQQINACPGSVLGAFKSTYVKNLM